MVDQVELLPCPKCQGAPRMERCTLYLQRGYLSCDCGIKFHGHYGDNLTKLADRWNTRTPTTPERSDG